MKQGAVLGYSMWDSPSDGAGPFRALFPLTKPIINYNDFDLIDALVLWGGSDISPSLYERTPIKNSGPANPSQRDLFEWELIRIAKETNTPIIGICRGAQLLCAYAGGILIQHVTGHTHDHPVTTNAGITMSSSSSHHQMMGLANTTHKLIAWSTKHQSTTYLPDCFESSQLEKRSVKEPEVVHFPTLNAIAIQGHPEWMMKTDPFVEWCLKVVANTLFKGD